MIKIIFTDLDGTLLDKNYRCDKALELIKKLEVPIVFVSAKTIFEQEVFRKMLGISDPFVVEDGSAIYAPLNYFGRRIGYRRHGYDALILGVEREVILQHIKSLNVKSYANMSVEEISKLTGLSLEMSELAKRREFSEVIVEADEKALKYLKKFFNVQIGGRFIHVYGKGADKGKAVRILTELYEDLYGEVVTIGIGNSYTDIPMLREVDIPALVRNEDGWIEVDFEVYRANGVATEGWVEVVKKFVGGD
ncbi:HAD-IIB family hydrolase [Archaeoglobus profundus]|uniref:Mannosyl-3-phosphoglycerate phosphatase family n=1 Tax=Archaeoglobus profundus (strain DSM 5631 / JCM 9629 / NBRC 100127 / Av18) TaxID=572546 RepID=D2RH79_ARCPA|nr:HAD-IIB family hydrolase [Archaeoglobus profundus]ADB57654.1 mannosyl-3-phosphoglycerate phosphatase family [Archaeoglobus profundus DSM 5631]